MLLHYDTLSWFRANQSFLFLLNTVYLAEKQQIPILKWGFEPMISYTWGEYATHEVSTLTITPMMWFTLWSIESYVIAVRYDLAIIEGNKFFFVISSKKNILAKMG